MRPEPSRFYHAEPGACPYHLIIGADRRPPNKVACTSARNVRKDESTQTITELADHFGLPVRVVSLIIKAARVVQRANETYSPDEVAAAVKEHHPGPDVSIASDIAGRLGIHSKQFYVLVKTGYIRPASHLAGVAMYSLHDAEEGLHKRRLKVDDDGKARQVELDFAAKENKAKGWKE